MTEGLEPETPAPPVTADEHPAAADFASVDSGTPEPRAEVAEAPETGDGGPTDPPGTAGARRSAAWASPGPDVPAAGPTLSFGFNLAKVPGHG